MSSLDNGLRVLALLSKQRPVLRVGEVCRTLEIPKSSASRLLRTMATHGLLEQEVQGPGYVVGPRAFELAGLYLSRNNLIDLIDEAVDRLVAEFSFVGYVCRLADNDLLILRRRQGSYPLRMLRDVGERVPAFQTAVGRALLAYGSDDQARATIARDPIWAPRIDVAIAKLGQIRKLGVVTSLSTHRPGVMATAAAVRDGGSGSGEMLAFSVSFPAGAADEATRARIAARVREEASRIGILLDDRAWLARRDMSQDKTRLIECQDPGARQAEPA